MGKYSKNVIITGSTKGIGKALAREFLAQGDNVFICSRSQEAVDSTVEELKIEFPAPKILGQTLDITDEESIDALLKAARSAFDETHIFINNAGMTQPEKLPLHEMPAEILEQVIRTNLLGTLLCSKAAIKFFKKQPSGGHVFLMDGAGSNGMQTADYAVYGVTKAGFPQLLKSLQEEQKDTKVGIHCLSPGLVATDLLMASTQGPKSTPAAVKKTFFVFNILAERPKTVAEYLVPKVKSAATKGSSGKYIKFLNGFGAFGRFMTVPCRINRLFTINEDGTVVDNESGKMLYSPDGIEAPPSDSNNNNSALLQR
jgi:chlorophyll(ide) b reductase